MRVNEASRTEAHRTATSVAMGRWRRLDICIKLRARVLVDPPRGSDFPLVVRRQYRDRIGSSLAETFREAQALLNTVTREETEGRAD